MVFFKSYTEDEKSFLTNKASLVPSKQLDNMKPDLSELLALMAVDQNLTQ